MQNQDGQRDWDHWNELKGKLDIAYKKEEIFWSQKQEYNGFKNEIKIPGFFMPL